MKKKITIGITQGDHNGIGLEVTLKALSDETMLELVTPVLYADKRLVSHAAHTFGIELPGLQTVSSARDAEEGCVNLVDLALEDATLTPGKPTSASGTGAVSSLRLAMSELKEGLTDAIVTAPINKEAARSDSFPYSGHTEYLGDEAGEGFTPQMILFDDTLRVALVTTHLPLAQVPSALTVEAVAASVTSMSRTLREDFNIERPKIAVLSLNPHCGDGGLLGTEEQEVISPAVSQCNDSGILAFGPYAADGFFGSGAYHRFDGVVAMYHDQGLAPFKALAGEHGVNFTAGLPFVRTSPDHGTAYDIAWQGHADATSMREAIYKAIDISRNRARYKSFSSNPLTPPSSERPPRPERRERQVKSFEPKDNINPRDFEAADDKAPVQS